MCKLTLTAGLCLIIASLGYPGLTDTAAVPPNPCDGGISGLYPNPADPHSFYNCGNGIAYLQNCPSNLVFDPTCSCCNYPPVTTTTNPTPIDNFCNGKNNGQYTNPTAPNYFYNCWDGNTYLQNCPLNLVFNQTCSCCDYPPNSNAK
ncbi:chondroitin proteoglycan 2-like [Perca fluviatilis]|uniref:chondroitin proteoglycan 2-like n=1 Tax=Perca fluviatilis TaxID=8168 RepID=UPI001962B808|nr:chondroitin proteoglycan 2-like [Perca fluviatilis]